MNFAGHSFAYQGVEQFDTAVKFGRKARIALDGGQVYEPAATTYKGTGTTVPTPSVRTGLTHDIYLVLEDPVPKTDADAARITVSVKPMMLWLWIGGR